MQDPYYVAFQETLRVLKELQEDCSVSNDHFETRLTALEKTVRELDGRVRATTFNSIDQLFKDLHGRPQ